MLQEVVVVQGRNLPEALPPYLEMRRVVDPAQLLLLLLLRLEEAVVRPI